MRPRPISRAFILAVLGAASVIISDPKNPESYQIAVGIIAAAISGGATKKEK